MTLAIENSHRSPSKDPQNVTKNNSYDKIKHKQQGMISIVVLLIFLLGHFTDTTLNDPFVKWYFFYILVRVYEPAKWLDLYILSTFPLAYKLKQHNLQAKKTWNGSGFTNENTGWCCMIILYSEKFQIMRIIWSDLHILDPISIVNRISSSQQMIAFFWIHNLINSSTY